MSINGRLRIALYHNLPHGGARRLLVELVARSAGVHDFDLFEIAVGDSVEAAVDASVAAHPALVGRLGRVTVERRGRGQRSSGILSPVRRIRELTDADASVARAIDAGGYDLAVVFPCRFRQAPELLTMLETPSLYYAPEPRRRSVEAAYDPTWRPARERRGLSLGALAGGWSRLAHERFLAAQDRRAVSAAGHVAACSASAAERFWMAYGRDAMVSHPGVDELLFRPPSPTWQGPSDSLERVPRTPGVVTVGALDPTKGHELAIDALALIPAEIRPELTIVHERMSLGYDTFLARRAAACQVLLRMVRGVTDDQLVMEYRNAAATLALARVEPFGLSVIESLACGTPVVALNEGGYRETVVDGVNGRLVERSPAAVAVAIAEVATRGSLFPIDRVVATVVPRWTWTAATTRFLEVLDRCAMATAVGR